MFHPVCTVDQIRERDDITIRSAGVPAVALMENAGRMCAKVLLERFPEARQRGVTIFAGKGNNGGDGWVMARMLHRQGVPVAVVTAQGERSRDCEVMAAAAKGVGVQTVAPEDAWGWVRVDALLGTGIKSAPKGEVRELLDQLMRPGGPILAVDMPTGLCGDSGRVLGDIAVPEVTVTFGAARIGQLLQPQLVGHLVVADIGLVDWAFTGTVLEGPEVADMLPAWPMDVHKHRKGHLGVFAGAEGMEGAAVLVCLGALRAGCGLVTLHSERIPRGLPIEVMHSTQPLDADYDAGAVGPGLGQTPEALRLWRRLAMPAVFDADGLNALGALPPASEHPRVITPHPGEAARLLGCTSAEVMANRLDAVQSLQNIAPALLKGQNTLIGGEKPCFNLTGGPMLATAGSGDVLTGIVGAFLARGLLPEDALTAAAFVHGVAGELAGPGCIASDIAAAIPAAMAALPTRTGLVDWRPLCG
jgi:ADP-dependent NAD(P)H-hydrate dehydratase / NAD(P)H-hydrate epimerase